MPSPDPLAASSIGYLVGAWTPGAGRVTHAYRGAVNLVLRGSLVSVVPDSLPDGPTVVRVPDRTWSALGAVRAGDRASIRAGILAVGQALVDLRTAEEWSGITSSPLSPRGLPGRVAAAREAALRAGGAAWIPDEVAAALAHPSPSFGRLVGRGIGLTPSGDDAIVGALAVVHAHDGRLACADTSRIATGVARLRPATTDLSAHLLGLAAEGHFGAPVLAAVDHILGAATSTGLDALLAVGATSGADCVLGITAATQHFAPRLSAREAA